MKDGNLIHLENGIRIWLNQQKSSITHTCLIINAGSRYEDIGGFGMAHLIEHLLFKRTKRRTTNQILNRLEQVGGDLNAYTTKEYTCIHASFLKPHLARALDLFEDVLFHSTFPEVEIEKEKSVILDEIASYLDSPEDSILDDFEDVLFQNSGLGHNILGVKEDLFRIDKEKIVDFIKRHYNTDEMVIAISGDYTMDQVKRICDKIFGHIPSRLKSNKFQGVEYNGGISKIVEKPINQAHFMLGVQTPGIYAKNKMSLLLLNNMLGGIGMSSILNLGIREKYGIAYTIESNVSLYSDTGSFCIYLGTDPEKLNKAVSLVQRELKKLKDNLISETKLKKAKEKFKGQIALAEEGRLSMIIAEAKNILDYGKVIPLHHIFKQIDAINSLDIASIANEYFNIDRFVSLSFVPEKDNNL